MNAFRIESFATTLLVGIGSLCSVAAMGDSLPVAAAAPAKSGSAAQAEPSNEPVLALSKPNGSGVTLRYVVPPKIAIGETVTVRLQFANVSAIDGAAVEVQEVSTRRQLVALRLHKGEPLDLDLPFTARVDGTQYLSVVSSQAGRSSVQFIPLRVGSGKVTLKTEGKRRVTPSGETVISMPASKQ